MIPLWIQWLIGIAAAVTALGVLWRKVLRPAAKLITITEEMLPLLQELTEEFKDTPHVFKILGQIQSQFRSDSGSTLKDQVNRLEAAAEKQELAAQTQEANAQHLKVAVESMAQRAKDEREQTQRLVLSLDRLSVKLDSLTIRVEAGAATAGRIEEHASAVATDLAEAHRRADAHDSGEAGAAADAAAQMTQKEKRESDAV